MEEIIMETKKTWIERLPLLQTATNLHPFSTSWFQKIAKVSCPPEVAVVFQFIRGERGESQREVK